MPFAWDNLNEWYNNFDFKETVLVPILKWWVDRYREMNPDAYNTDDEKKDEKSKSKEAASEEETSTG